MLTAADIAALVAELAPRIVGGQAQKVREPDAATVVISVRAPGQTTHLVLSATPGAARIAERPGASGTLPAPSALGGWLRANLKGRVIRGLEQVGGDRVVRLSFDAGAVVAELTGRSANLYAVDTDGRIVAMARQARGDGPSPGATWEAPAPRPATAATPRFASALAVEAAAQAIGASAVADVEAAERTRVLRWATRRLQRLETNLSADIERLGAGEEAQRFGELLKSQLHAFRRGDAQVAVTDWYAEGMPQVIVPLDPKLDPKGNVERYFRLHRKAQSGLEQATARRDAARAALARLAPLADAPLETVHATLRALGLRPPVAGPAATRREATPRRPFRVWTTPRGDAIWVGRGGADNHALTFQHARGNDVWLHVRDCPGAHVIIPLRGGGAVHPETLLDAAALAATHSDLRDEAVVDVTWTPRKQVRAVKGGAPGRVSVAGGRTLAVDQPGRRVARLLREEV